MYTYTCSPNQTPSFSQMLAVVFFTACIHRCNFSQALRDALKVIKSGDTLAFWGERKTRVTRTGDTHSKQLTKLVGGFNPSEKYESKKRNLPQVGMDTKQLTTRWFKSWPFYIPCLEVTICLWKGHVFTIPKRSRLESPGNSFSWWFGARWFGFRLDPRKWKGVLLVALGIQWSPNISGT